MPRVMESHVGPCALMVGLLALSLSACSASSPHIYRDCAAFPVEIETPPFEDDPGKYVGTHLPKSFEPVSGVMLDGKPYVIACRAKYSKNAKD